MLLLQSSPDLTLYLVIGIVAFFIGIFITRAVFAIDKQLDNQKAQIRLLAKIAKQQGVDENEIREVLGLSLKPSAASVDDEIKDIARTHGLTVAIKEANARRGKGMEDAKSYVEGLMKKRGVPDKDGMITP